MVPVLTIAGSDPCGGAGVQGDLKTFAAHGVYGAAVIVALTVQNTLGVARVVPVDAALVSEQIESVLADIGAAATKLGMLANAAVVHAVAAAAASHRLGHLVLDPVTHATSGARLLDDEGIEALRARLLPLVDVITPNLQEAEVLTGQRVRSPVEAGDAARRLVELGARAAIVTGGHYPGAPTDVLFDGIQCVEIGGERVPSNRTHGTGCAFAAAMAARLARGEDLESAVRAAKAYVARAIRQAPALGRGRGPLRHDVEP